MNSEHCASFLLSDQCQQLEVWHLAVKCCLHKSLVFWSERSFQKYASSFIWQNSMHCLCVHSLVSPAFHLWWFTHGFLNWGMSVESVWQRRWNNNGSSTRNSSRQTLYCYTWIVTGEFMIQASSRFYGLLTVLWISNWQDLNLKPNKTFLKNTNVMKMNRLYKCLSVFSRNVTSTSTLLRKNVRCSYMFPVIESVQ